MSPAPAKPIRPAPYYSEDGIEIYHGDCREVLRTFSGNVILTDPPFGISLENHDKDVANLPRGWDIANDHDTTLARWIYDFATDFSLPLAMFMSPKKRIAGPWREELVWDKGPAVGGGGDFATYWKACHELIGLCRTRRRGTRDSSVLQFWIGPGDFPFHPAQKPLALMKYLVSKLSDESDIIVDPCMGSGSTLEAAKLCGRSAIGIEIEERYCEIAAKRLAQGVLFGSEARP